MKLIRLLATAMAAAAALALPRRRPGPLRLHRARAALRLAMQMARTICVEHDPEAFRASLENAGFLRPGAPLSTQAIVEHLAVFYDTIREPGPGRYPNGRGRGQMAGPAPAGRGVTAPNHPAVGTAPAEPSADRGAAAGQIGTERRSDEQIYYSI